MIANTRFSEISGVAAQAPARNAPQLAPAHDVQAVEPDQARANRTTWLFPPIGKHLTQ